MKIKKIEKDKYGYFMEISSIGHVRAPDLDDVIAKLNEVIDCINKEQKTFKS